MSDAHAFEIRRLETDGGGDALRDGNHPVRYGPSSIPLDYLGSLSARPLDYDAVEITLGASSTASGTELVATTSETYLGTALVRSSFGFPEHPQDGVVVQAWEAGQALPEQIIDGNLSQGCWYYYSLMTRYADSRWHVAYRTQALVPFDYKHRDAMWGLTPPFYQKTDGEPYRDIDNNALYRLYSVIGYDLDYTRTLTEGVQELWNPDTAPLPLLRLLGKQNLGAEGEGKIGDTHWRGVVSQNRLINGRRGTLDGLRRFVESASKYATVATKGLNELLLVDDAEMVDGVGHWAPSPFSVNYYFRTHLLLSPAFNDVLPTPEIGADGDMYLYIEGEVRSLYGPKDGNDWGNANALLDGEPTGLIYESDRNPNADDGEAGYYWINASDSTKITLFGPKTEGGSWGSPKVIAGVPDTSKIVISTVPESEIDNRPIEAI